MNRVFFNLNIWLVSKNKVKIGKKLFTSFEYLSKMDLKYYKVVEHLYIEIWKKKKQKKPQVLLGTVLPWGISLNITRVFALLYSTLSVKKSTN